VSRLGKITGGVRGVRDKLTADRDGKAADASGDRPKAVLEAGTTLQVTAGPQSPVFKLADVETHPEPPPPIPPDTDEAAFNRAVPFGVRVFAGWSWRLLIIAALVLAAGYGIAYLSEVFVPLAVALLLTALLSPIAVRLKSWRVPPVLAALISLLGGTVVVVGSLTLIGTLIAGQATTLATQAVSGVQKVLGWVSTGPLHIGDTQIKAWETQIQTWAKQSSRTIAGYAADIGTTIGHFLAGIAVAFFATFFFLFEGRTIWSFLLKLVPRVARRRTDEAARLGWSSLVAFVRATVVVALADAVGVLIVALILRVPVAPALAALVFFGAFVPIVGALVSGFVAVAVALVALGWVQALIMLAGVILVIEIEGHALQPFLMGRAVAIHPLAIILGIAIGIILGGIVGALLAVPVLAFGRTFISHLASSSQDIDLRRNIIV